MTKHCIIKEQYLVPNIEQHKSRYAINDKNIFNKYMTIKIKPMNITIKQSYFTLPTGSI